jgi:hypothetical protein
MHCVRLSARSSAFFINFIINLVKLAWTVSKCAIKHQELGDKDRLQIDAVGQEHERRRNGAECAKKKSLLTILSQFGSLKFV